MKSRGHLITAVIPGSIAQELEIKPGDRLLSIDGHDIGDVFDYRFYVNCASMSMVILKENGEEWEFDIEHNYEDIGLDFDLGLMSECKATARLPYSNFDNFSHLIKNPAACTGRGIFLRRTGKRKRAASIGELFHWGSHRPIQKASDPAVFLGVFHIGVASRGKFRQGDHAKAMAFFRRLGQAV